MPSRSSRFNVGPWFAWWGFDGLRNKRETYKADFDTVKCLIKEVKITPDPDSIITDYAQPFNQNSPFVDNEAGQQPFCDIRTLDGEVEMTPPRQRSAS